MGSFGFLFLFLFIAVFIRLFVIDYLGLADYFSFSAKRRLRKIPHLMYIGAILNDNSRKYGEREE